MDTVQTAAECAADSSQRETRAEKRSQKFDTAQFEASVIAPHSQARAVQSGLVLLAFDVPYGEECEEHVRELWSVLDDACDEMPWLRSSDQSWQPAVWQARGLAPHRSLVLLPCREEEHVENSEDIEVAVVIDLCVDKAANTFFPRLLVLSRTAVPPIERLIPLNVFKGNLPGIAQATVTAFRRFRKYSLVGSNCQDLLYEMGRDLNLQPLETLRPQADLLTESLESRARPTFLRVAGFVGARIAATAVGCSPAIAVVDGVGTLGAFGLMLRKGYRRLRAKNMLSSAIDDARAIQEGEPEPPARAEPPEKNMETYLACLSCG